MNKSVMAAIFAVGLAVVGWVGWGFVGSSPLALAMTVVIAAVYVVGAYELMQFRAATSSLSIALAGPGQQPLVDLGGWLERLHSSLRNPVRQRIDGERVPLPGPALAPYLVGLLVMLGMLGTFLGMVVTFNGAVFALEASSSLESIRAALAAPIKGLGLSFGTSVAGVAASAMLGLMSALCRRERLAALRMLDARIASDLRPFSAAHRRQEMFEALQAQAQAMPLIAERLQGLMEGLERRHEQLNGQLQDQQQVFHREAAAAYTQLATTVGASLHDSLGASARMAGETIRPVVEQAMATLAQEAERSHQRLREATGVQMHALTAQWEGTARQVADTWTEALDRHTQTQDQQAAQLGSALQSITQTLEQRTTTLLATLQETVAQSQAAQLAADQQRLAGWSQSMEGMASRLAEQWQLAGEQTAQQQRGVCQALEGAATQLDQSLQTASQAFEQRTTTLLASLEQTVEKTQADQAVADQQRLAGWSQSMEGMASRLAEQWQQVGEQTAQQQRGVCQALEGAAAQLTERMTEQVHQALGGAARLMDQSDALLHTRIEAEARWADTQAQRMDALAGVWRTELVALRDAEAARGQAAVERLDALQAAVAGHLATLGSALEAPLTRLLQTASDVPQAAAEVITQLRQEMTHLSERDNAALAERTAMMEQLGVLLQSVNEAAGQQRAAIESLVGSAASVLEQAGQEFAQALGAQAGKVDEVSAHVAASAVELSSLGESFGHGVELFTASNEKLMDSLQRIEGAIGQSMSRSDEQLAYYVAQAREVIDLSISSQQGIVEDLRRLNGQMAAAVQGVAA
ncbi:uncharacterized protein DUF802 [Acidovorax sp. 94]|uniref:DUF802 domain-containing protein n=1 Tax=Acidovorax sp. 94 TaxID=2135633 RepID=UPI000EB5C391|nr:DUF802 domain-containing protein [Acidovorax sp. 94]RKR66229.1 uncharacterized protein DUF802 [Acidovorax sp. 94]